MILSNAGNVVVKEREDLVGHNMGDPEQIKKKLNRMRNTDRIVARRRRIILRTWSNDSHLLFTEGIYCDGHLRKYNLRCGCRQCKYAKERFKNKGYRKARNRMLRSMGA